MNNWCFWTVVLQKILESPLDCKEIKLINPNGNQSWIFIGRTGAEAETPVLWPLDAKNWLIGKAPDAGKDWRQKGMTEDEMAGWHHQLNRHEFEQALGVGDGQRSLVCCSPWGHKESDMTEWLNWLTEHEHCRTLTVFQLSMATKCPVDETAKQREDSCPGQQQPAAQDVITWLRMMHKVTVTNCLFLEFSI